MSQTRNNYTPLLNALDNMKHSPAYAVRRGILQGAVDAIISLQIRLQEIEQVPEVAVPCKKTVEMCARFLEGQRYMVLSPTETYSATQHTQKLEHSVSHLADLMRRTFTPSHNQQSAEVWQPIETAPKDGSRLLLATPTGKLADGMWSTKYGVWSWPYVMAEPTHWMIAPPIPSHENEQLKTAWYCGGCGQTDPSKRCLGCRA